jgi:hypothetical protein
VASLIRPQLWGMQKPPAGATLRSGHPLAPATAWLLNDGGGALAHDLGGRYPLTLSSGTALGPGGLLLDNNTAHRAEGAGPSINGAVPWSYLIRHRPGAINANMNLVNVGSVGANLQNLSFRIINSTTLAANSYNFDHSATVPAMVAGTSYTEVLATASDGSAFRQYHNGVEVLSSTWSAGTLNTDNNWQLGVSNQSFYFWAYQGEIETVYVYPRQLTPTEVAWLEAEPWAPLAPPAPTLRYWVVVAGSGAYTQSLSGTLATSGAFATRELSRGLAGTLATAGVVGKGIDQDLAGALATSSDIVRQTTKSPAGVLVSAGTIRRESSKSTAGTLATDGAAIGVRSMHRTLAGTLASVGALGRAMGKSLSGNLRLEGVLSGLGEVLRMLASVFAGR